jgi:hypothetical protein
MTRESLRRGWPERLPPGPATTRAVRAETGQAALLFCAYSPLCSPGTLVQAKTLIGLGSGEGFQLGSTGSGWVLVQPSEGRPGVQT